MQFSKKYNKELCKNKPYITNINKIVEIIWKNYRQMRNNNIISIKLRVINMWVALNILISTTNCNEIISVVFDGFVCSNITLINN